MVFVSLTRLRIRSIWFMPRFAWQMLVTRNQIQTAPGFQRGSTLADRKWTFWTMTAWDSQESMRAYMTSGAHQRAMPFLLDWCDEASVAHWSQPEAALPTWVEADQRMRSEGRVSKVRHPSAQQADLRYAAPRTAGALALWPK